SQAFMITVAVPVPAPDPASRRPAQTPELQLPCLIRKVSRDGGSFLFGGSGEVTATEVDRRWWGLSSASLQNPHLASGAGAGESQLIVFQDLLRR
ncbi:hypothetical protein ACFV3F_27770, partial [Streptomyces sp. NPDC059717]|uniref:hypothetical protein n=1 Tax=Streptomyces sp. NPDC059717 TaxID=3346922 RepID=UPI00368EBED2